MKRLKVIIVLIGFGLTTLSLITHPIFLLLVIGFISMLYKLITPKKGGRYAFVQRTSRC